MIEAWDTLDERRQAFLIDSEASDDEAELRYLVVMDDPSTGTNNLEITGAFRTHLEASEHLSQLGYKYVGLGHPYH